jgi:hypothetical protein
MHDERAIRFSAPLPQSEMELTRSNGEPGGANIVAATSLSGVNFSCGFADGEIFANGFDASENLVDGSGYDCFI